jgi:hypothetical protein
VVHESADCIAFAWTCNLNEEVKATYVGPKRTFAALFPVRASPGLIARLTPGCGGPPHPGAQRFWGICRSVKRAITDFAFLFFRTPRCTDHTNFCTEILQIIQLVVRATGSKTPQIRIPFDKMQLEEQVGAKSWGCYRFSCLSAPSLSGNL